MKKDIAGQRFGRLVAIKPDGVQGNNTKWLCKCDCGNYKTTNISSLTRGLCKSCGCLRKENTASMFRKHGCGSTKLYAVYCTMKARCNNPNSEQYQYYGAKGVCVCDEWKDDFMVFRDWAMENGYEEGKSIDRIDANGDYEPSNCRWTGKKAQANNKGNNVAVTYNNETHTIAEWADITGISYAALYKRIVIRKWSIEKALTQKERTGA